MENEEIKEVEVTGTEPVEVESETTGTDMPTETPTEETEQVAEVPEVAGDTSEVVA